MKKFNKKLIGIILSIMLISSLLVACGDNTETSGEGVNKTVGVCMPTKDLQGGTRTGQHEERLEDAGYKVTYNMPTMKLLNK